MESLPALFRERWLHRSQRQWPRELLINQQERILEIKEEVLLKLLFQDLLGEMVSWEFGNKVDQARAQVQALRLRSQRRHQRGLKLRPWTSRWRTR